MRSVRCYTKDGFGATIERITLDGMHTLNIIERWNNGRL